MFGQLMLFFRDNFAILIYFSPFWPGAHSNPTISAGAVSFLLFFFFASSLLYPAPPFYFSDLTIDRMDDPIPFPM